MIAIKFLTKKVDYYNNLKTASKERPRFYEGGEVYSGGVWSTAVRPGTSHTHLTPANQSDARDCVWRHSDESLQIDDVWGLTWRARCDGW